MIRILGTFLIIVLTAGSAIASDNVVLKAKNGDITFNHKVHSGSMECKLCHGDSKPSKIELDKDKGHVLCKECHRKNGRGPTKCGDCHKN